MSKVVAIVLAGGSGKRMGTKIKKQYIMLQGKEVLAYTLDVFEQCDLIQEIIVVTGKEDIKHVKENICDRYNIQKVSHIVEGGKERQDSVYNGLKAVGECDYIAIHDGARPFVTEEEIRDCIEGAKKYNAAILGVRVKDTIKQVDATGQISATPDRKMLWAVHTPQIFSSKLIKEAYQYAYEKEIQGTDDSSLMEAMGQSVYIVEGKYTNIKLTTPEDLLWGEVIISKRR